MRPPDNPAPNFPNHDLNFNQKNTKEWCGQFARAFFHQFKNSSIGVFYNKAPQYAINRAYAIGKQPIDIYKRQMKFDDKSQAYVNINWKVPRVWPKFRNIIRKKLAEAQYTIGASAIDKTALDEKRNHRNMLRAKIQMAEQMAAQEAAAGMPAPGPEVTGPDGRPPTFMPRTPEDLEMYMEMDYKHRAEIYAEQGLDLMLYHNDWKMLRKLMHKDFIDCDCALFRDYVDGNGFIRLKRIDPSTGFCGTFERPDMKDCRSFGHHYEMTISELRLQAGSQFTEEQYAEMASKSSGFTYYAADLATSNLSQSYDGVRLKVFTCEWASADFAMTETKKNRYGNELTYSVPFSYKEKQNSRQPRTVSRKKVQTWYTCTWIVGTDYYYDFGLAYDIKRPKDNPQDAISSFHGYVLNMENNDTQALSESVITFVDGFCLAWFKWQHLIAQARPPGEAIDVDTMDNVMPGKGGKMMDPLDIMEIREQTGTWLYRGVDAEGNQMNRNPVHEVKGGLSAELFRMVDIMEYNMKMIQTTSGLNDVTDATSPAPGSLVGVGMQAMAATNSALGHMFDADVALTENIANSLVLRFQDKCRNYDGKDWYVEAMGTEAVYFMKANADISHHTMGIKLEALPTNEEKAHLENIITTAQQTRVATGVGGIEPEDAIQVREMMKTSLKKAVAYLAFRRKKRAEEDAARKAQDVELNSKQQQDSAQVTAQLADQSAEAQLARELKKMQEEHRLKVEYRQLDHQLGMEMEGKKTEGKNDNIVKKGEVDEALLQEEAEVFDAKGARMRNNTPVPSLN